MNDRTQDIEAGGGSRTVAGKGDGVLFILASASPRRLELLARVGIIPDAVEAADIDESPAPRELAAVLAARLAREKVAAVARDHKGAIILGADTVVARGRRILPKARDEHEARAFLGLLSGRRHRVYGGVAVSAPDHGMRTRTVMTRVTFKRLCPSEIDAYIASGEWRGKAGAYAIQGRAAAFVRSINGSYTNVVGLPLLETVSLLAAAGHGPAMALR